MGYLKFEQPTLSTRRLVQIISVKGKMITRQKTTGASRRNERGSQEISKRHATNLIVEQTRIRDHSRICTIDWREWRGKRRQHNHTETNTTTHIDNEQQNSTMRNAK